jgi:NDP-sugar pyrophosphorylase family protein
VSKQRLTITLSSSTLNQVDQLIDKKKIRSRSHAIETILQDHFQPSINTAVLLAGGDSTSKEFKPLKTYNNSPLICHLLSHLESYQINRIIILTNHQGSKLRSILDDKYPHLKTDIIFEEKPLGTAGAIKSIQDLINKTFFCLHADIFTTINLQEMAAFHHSHQALATIAVKPKISHKAFDNVLLQGNQVESFQPKNKEVDVSLVNSGIYIFEPELFGIIPNKPKSTLERDVFPKIAKSKQLYAYSFQGEWFDVDTEQEYLQDTQSITNK